MARLQSLLSWEAAKAKVWCLHTLRGPGLSQQHTQHSPSLLPLAAPHRLHPLSCSLRVLRDPACSVLFIFLPVPQLLTSLQQYLTCVGLNSLRPSHFPKLPSLSAKSTEHTQDHGSCRVSFLGLIKLCFLKPVGS